MTKIDRLRTILKRLKRVVIAYSGGLDSVFLLKVSVDTLGKDNVLAVTARSETYPYSEYKEARRLAKLIGARHIVIKTSELSIKGFKDNPVNRCYFCKRELFKKMEDIKNQHGMKYVLDGTNKDDLKDVRHGRRAAAEFKVESPLLNAGITKDDIRRYSRILKLPTWKKPSFACLASRFPFKSPITLRGLGRVEKAEEFLHKRGLVQVRVRSHGDMARIEISDRDFNKAMRNRIEISRKLKSLGFAYVSLDLEGYRTGSMHESVGH